MQGAICGVVDGAFAGRPLLYFSSPEKNSKALEGSGRGFYGGDRASRGRDKRRAAGANGPSLLLGGELLRRQGRRRGRVRVRAGARAARQGGEDARGRRLLGRGSGSAESALRCTRSAARVRRAAPA